MKPRNLVLLGFVLGLLAAGFVSLWSRDAVIEAQAATIKEQEALLAEQHLSVEMANNLLDVVFPGFHGRPLPNCVPLKRSERQRVQ